MFYSSVKVDRFDKLLESLYDEGDSPQFIIRFVG